MESLGRAWEAARLDICNPFSDRISHLTAKISITPREPRRPLGKTEEIGPNQYLSVTIWPSPDPNRWNVYRSSNLLSEFSG
ncbi:MAG: hypothetical protein RLZZ527_553, partial [Actinomycetota bacterium]